MNLIEKLHDPEFQIPDWLFNVLSLRHPEKTESLRPFYDFLLNEALTLDGDVAEFGVFRGDSLLSSALFLTRLGSKKKVIGFDTFSGFPKLHAMDESSRFEVLHEKGKLSTRHLENVKMLREAESLGLYKQHQFQTTSQELVKSRVETLRLKNVVLYAGDFKETLRTVPATQKYSVVLMDSDLYESHEAPLHHSWEKLTPGGIIYLDEYYSLKYPGARTAIEEFCDEVKTDPIRCLGLTAPGGFERWFLKKPLRR